MTTTNGGDIITSDGHENGAAVFEGNARLCAAPSQDDGRLAVGSSTGNSHTAARYALGQEIAMEDRSNLEALHCRLARPKGKGTTDRFGAVDNRPRTATTIYADLENPTYHEDPGIAGETARFRIPENRIEN